MALLSGARSTLNPDAPLFVPAAFRQVEDFSPEWWQLVTTSTWFHEYWLSQRQTDDELFGDTENENGVDDLLDFLPETFDLDVFEDVNNVKAQFEEFIDQSTNSEGGRGLELNEERVDYAENPADSVSPPNKQDHDHN